MPVVQTRTPKAKTATKAAAATKTAASAPAAKPRTGKGSATPQQSAGAALNVEERERLIAQAAYFRAEKRGFAPGCELQDWVEAEAEVLRLIGKA